MCHQPTIQFFVAGDFNVTLNMDTPAVMRVSDFLHSYGLYWLSHEPTRGANCLDSIASNCTAWDKCSSVVNSLVADHLAVVFDYNTDKVGTSNICSWHSDYVSQYRKLDKELFSTVRFELSKVNWEFVYSEIDPEIALFIFLLKNNPSRNQRSKKEILYLKSHL